jgi:hypothetical protein
VTLSRRDLLKVTAGAFAYDALPSFAKTAKRSADTPVTCAPLDLCRQNMRWWNKHENVSLMVERLYRPLNRTADCNRFPEGREWEPGLAALKTILAEAERLNKRVRAVGGTWALSESATCPDFMIDTSPLNYHAPIASEHVSAESLIAPRHLFFAQCGTSVMELNTDLQARGLCLRTSGASQGQTICGAFSTGTHGSAVDLGAMQDYVVGIHLLVDAGKSYWLEPASHSIVTDSFCAKLGAVRLADDDLFHAALVSFGCFGVIHAVLLEVEEIYSLNVQRFLMDWDDIKQAAGTLDFSKLPVNARGDTRPFHFEVDLNPYGTKKGSKGASVLMMHKVDYAASPRCTVVDKEFGVDVLAVIGGITSTLPALVPLITNELFHGLFPEKVDTCDQGPRGNVFGATEIKGKSMSCEIGISLDTTLAAMDVLIRAAEKFHFPGLLCQRYVRPSKAKLAFTKFAPVTCTIEIPAAASKRTAEFYMRAFDALKGAQIPFTLHWGQMNNFTRQVVRDMWGPAVDDWIAARHGVLTTPKARYMFSNKFSEDCGLDV